MDGERGQALHGELGYGPHGRKSAANPDKIHSLDGVYTHQVLLFLPVLPALTYALLSQK